MLRVGIVSRANGTPLLIATATIILATGLTVLNAGADQDVTMIPGHLVVTLALGQRRKGARQSLGVCHLHPPTGESGSRAAG